MMIDKHMLVGVRIVGSSLDMLGTLYLVYDLLGGEHGPLGTFTRGVTSARSSEPGRPRSRAGIWARERRGARHHTCLGVFPRFEAWTEAGILA